jgi:hypothetical protein
VAGSRIYVQEGIYDAFVKKSVELAKKSVVGDPFNPNVHQGPQVMYMHDLPIPVYAFFGEESPNNHLIIVHKSNEG